MKGAVSMIRAVIFDFGNVISAFDPGIFLRNLRPYTDRTVEEMRDLIYGSDLHRSYEAGWITSREFFSETARRCGLGMTEERFADAFTEIFTPIESTARLIADLKGRYRLGLLSNTNAWHYERHIRRVDVFPLFDSVTLSFEVKALKPDEAIYRDALAKLGHPPEECAYIDDVEEYAAGARGIGIHGLRYTGNGELLASLRALGVSA